MNIFARKLEPPAVPGPTWEQRRRAEIPAELRQLEAELALVDVQIEQFWNGPDPRMRVMQDRSAAAFEIKDYPKLRVLDSQRDDLLRRRARLLLERAELMEKKP